jgi:5'-nucleotidase
MKIHQLTAVLGAMACVGCTGDEAPAPSATISLRVLAINDLHGHLRPPPAPAVTLPDGTETRLGGVAYLAPALAALRAGAPHSLFVSAGDLIGGSPLLSGLFHDEPTIEVMNALGLDYNGVGNHEFDEGLAELRRMQMGGCHPTDGCVGGVRFAGARFRFLAANVAESGASTTIFPRYDLRDVGGVQVAVVGMTLRDTPGVVPASGVAGLAFADEVATVNALVPELRRAGVETIIVVLHQGGTVALSSSPYDGCDGLTGPITSLARDLDEAVDVIASAHSHAAYICRVGRRLVTSAGSYGRLVTAVDLRIDRATHDVVASSARNWPVVNTAAPDPAIEAIVARYEALAADRAARPLGTITATLNRAPSPGGQSTLGSVVADAQLAATRGAGAVMAFQQNGGLRADLDYARSGAETADGRVTFGEGYAVHPFGNVLWTATFTGAQVLAILEGQFEPGRSVLQVSRGVSYTWDATRPVGARVDPAEVLIGGRPLDLAASYRVTFNEAAPAGNPALSAGTDVRIGPVDLEALEGWFAAQSPIGPPPADRILRRP